jgi:hypothetical protein
MNRITLFMPTRLRDDRQTTSLGADMRTGFGMSDLHTKPVVSGLGAGFPALSSANAIDDVSFDRFDSFRAIKLRSRLFVLASRFFLTAIALEIAYLLYHGMAFAPALRNVQFATDAIRERGGIEAYRLALKQAVDQWPSLIAQHAPTPDYWIGVAIVLVLVTSLFYAIKDHPSGTLIDLENPHIPLQRRQELAAALQRDGTTLRLFLLRNDQQRGSIINLIWQALRLFQRRNYREAAYRSGDRLFIGSGIREDLLRKQEIHAGDKLGFIAEHESMHHEAADNAFYGIGRTIIFLATGIAVLFSMTVIPLAVATLPSGTLLRAVPDGVSVSLVAVSSLFLAMFIGSVANGFASAFAQLREFFADRAAALRYPAGIPYRVPPGIAENGDLFSAWRLAPTILDRFDHVAGRSPYVTAFAALSIGLWGVTRTAVLIVDPQGSAGFVWGFDAAVLIPFGLALWVCPAPMRRKASPGLLPWIGLLLFISAALVLVLKVRSFAQTTLHVDIVSTWWIAAVVAPLLIVASTVAVVLAASARRADAAPGATARNPGIRHFTLFLLATPAYSISFGVAGYAFYVLSLALGRLTWVMLDNASLSSVSSLDMAAIAPAVLVLLAIIFNMTRATRMTACIEIGIIWMLAAIAIGASLAMIAMNRQSAGNFNLESMMDLVRSDFATYVFIPGLYAALFCAVLALSWLARLRILARVSGSRSGQ